MVDVGVFNVYNDVVHMYILVIGDALVVTDVGMFVLIL